MNIREFESYLRKEDISFVPRNGYILLFNSVRNLGLATETKNGIILKSHEHFYIPPYISKLNYSVIMSFMYRGFLTRIYLIHGVKDYVSDPT